MMNSLLDHSEGTHKVSAGLQAIANSYSNAANNIANNLINWTQSTIKASEDMLYWHNREHLGDSHSNQQEDNMKNYKKKKWQKQGEKCSTQTNECKDLEPRRINKSTIYHIDKS